jgi:hypothetical protein
MKFSVIQKRAEVMPLLDGNKKVCKHPEGHIAEPRRYLSHKDQNFAGLAADY